MGSLMKNLKIGTRIVLSLVLPIAGLLVFASYVVFSNFQTAREMEKLTQLEELAPVISNVVHELQKERGTSAVYIGSKGQVFADELPLQKQETDAKHAALSAAWGTIDPASYGERLAQKVKAAKTALGNLKSIRSKVGKLTASVPEMAAYYTPTIAHLLSIIEEMPLLSSNAHLSNSITAYTSLLQGKERAGIERAMGGAGFGAGNFAPAVYRKFIELIAQQNTYFTLFLNYASPEEAALYKKTMVGPDVAEVERLRQIAIDSIESKDTQGIKGPYWFASITKKIDLMKKVEDTIADDLGHISHKILSDAKSLLFASSAAALVLLLITGVLVTVIVRGITRPVASMTNAMSVLADGDLTVEIQGTERGDEIGTMATTLQVFKDNAIRVKNLEDEQREAEIRAKDEQRRTMNKMADDFEASVGGVVDAVSSASAQLQASAQALSTSSEQTSNQANAVSSASEQASANVQTVAAAAEELSASISEISRQVQKSSEVANSAVTESQRANEMVQGLATAASKIGEVVSLITDIAEQTNLLALNATIEAARAGEAGKGFAVVASEVKNLANQTAKATEEISSQIGGIQSATQGSVEAIGSISTTITEISQIASAIAAAVEEQGAATQEIARNVEEASAGTGEVATNISGVTKAANEGGRSAGDVLTSANSLHEQSGILKSEVDKFVAQVRAA